MSRESSVDSYEDEQNRDNGRYNVFDEGTMKLLRN